MLIRQKTLNTCVTILFCLIILIIFSITKNEPSIILAYLLLAFIGTVLFRKQDNLATQFFFYAFTLYVSLAILFTSLHSLEHGDPFTGLGEDDKGYYETAKDYKDGIRKFEFVQAEWSAINYKAYIIILSGWLKLLNILGFNSDFYFNLNILNCFIGAFSAPFMYLIFRRWATERQARIIATLTLLYPPVVYYSAAIIRDVTILTLFSLGVLIADSEMKRVKKVILSILILWVLACIRDASAFFLAVFFVGHWLYKLNPRTMGATTKTLILFGIGFFIVLFTTVLSETPKTSRPPITHVLEYVNYRIHYYFKLSAAEGDENSLGGKIRASQNPLVLATSVPITYFSPAPPLFFYKQTVSHWFLGLGNMLWYFFGFVYLLTVVWSRQGQVNRLYIPILATLSAALLLISFTSGDFRHLFFLHPFLIGFAVIFLFKNKGQIHLILGMFGLLMVVLISIYITLKLLA